MSNRATPNEEEETRRLVVAITDFLRDQLATRTDLVPEDRDCLEIAVQCLEMAFGLDTAGYIQYRFARPLLDIFMQVTQPVSVRDKLQADTYKNEGNDYMRQSMYQEADTKYTDAIELDRWNSIYYCNRANARIELQNFFDAIADCRQALVLNPDYAKAHARMGQAYALLNRPREAARCFRQAVELEPDNDRYRNNLRVAESQIPRPDSMTLLANLLSSMLGMTPPGYHAGANRNPNLNIPPSFMIISETHPPTSRSSDGSEQNAQTMEVASQVADRQAGEHNQVNEIVYPYPFGVVNEGSQEQSTLPIPPATENEAGGNTPMSQEYIFELPGFIFIQNDMRTPSGETETTTVSENVSGKSADSLLTQTAKKEGEKQRVASCPEVDVEIRNDSQSADEADAEVMTMTQESDANELRSQYPTQAVESVPEESKEDSTETPKYDFSRGSTEIEEEFHTQSDEKNESETSQTSPELSSERKNIEENYKDIDSDKTSISEESIKNTATEVVGEIAKKAKSQENLTQTDNQSPKQMLSDSSESTDKNTSSNDSSNDEVKKE